MAKVIQLAKDLLKGGSKEDIYPKTVDSAVYTTDKNGNTTTLDKVLSKLKDGSIYYITIIPRTDVQGYNANIVDPESFNYASIAEAIANNKQVIVKNMLLSNYNVFYNLIMTTNTQSIFAVSGLSSDISGEYVIIDSNGAKITSTLDIDYGN